MKSTRIGIAWGCLLMMSLAAWADPAPAPYRVGRWLPSDRQTLNQWIDRQVRAVDSEPAQDLHPSIREFQALIERDPVLFMHFTRMFEQVPAKPPYLSDPTGRPRIRDYSHMLQVLNHILTQPPEFNETGLVGFPINAILDWPMGTPAGAAAFLDPRVNAQLKKILNQWAVFLSSPESCSVLNDDPKTGWFGAAARQAMPTFVEDFVCDTNLPHYGFTSWDDFFTRTFREGRRPVALPDDDAIVANACESAPYRVARDVRLRDTFWIKAQPYSLAHMLANDPLAAQFEGATVYQAFLSALSYHRWHSPVSGTIVKTRLIDGSYYAEALSEGYDPAGPNDSQAYITQVAARALIFIEADNPAIGLMACLFVGMAEVSSNDITVHEGQHVEKGEQLGMFHFGGSTHCLIFQPQVRIQFNLHGQTPGLHTTNIPVRARIATVSPDAVPDVK